MASYPNTQQSRLGKQVFPLFKMEEPKHVTGSVVQGAAGYWSRRSSHQISDCCKELYTFACTGAAGTACRFRFGRQH